MTTLQLNTSLFGEGGQSTTLANEFVAKRGGKVIVRDLAKNPVPHLSAERFGAFLAKPEARTPEQQAVIDYSDALIAELREADTIVIGLPMYNFSVPSTLRASAFCNSHPATAGAIHVDAPTECVRQPSSEI